MTWVASRGRPLAGGKLTSGYCELACLCISCVHRPAVLSTPTCVGNSSTSPEFAPMSVRLSRSSTQWPRLCKVRKSPRAVRDVHGLSGMRDYTPGIKRTLPKQTRENRAFFLILSATPGPLRPVPSPALNVQLRRLLFFLSQRGKNICV